MMESLAGKKSLDEDDLFDVVSALKPIEAKWKELGSALRLRSSTLGSIQATYAGNLQGCLHKVVDEWLKRNYNTAKFGEPSWQKLVEAVRHEAGGNHGGLADEIAGKYLQLMYDLPDHGNSNSFKAESFFSKTKRDECSVYNVGTPSHTLSSNWYYDVLSREEAEKSLNSVVFACFLVRESAKKTGELVISIKDRNKTISHYRIQRGPGWYEVEGTYKQFQSVSELVKFYQTHSITDDPNVKLITPCPKDAKNLQCSKTLPSAVVTPSTSVFRSPNGTNSSQESKTCIKIPFTTPSTQSSFSCVHTYEEIGSTRKLSKDQGCTLSHPLAPLSSQQYFHGSISRVKAEALVVKDGDFLIRESTSKSPGQFVLTGMAGGIIGHLLLVDKEGKVKCRNREFESIPHLVNHFREHNFPLVFDGQAFFLKYPVLNFMPANDH